MTDDSIKINYFLPKTIIRFSGTSVKTTNELAPTERRDVTEYIGQAELVTQPDLEAARALEIPTESFAKIGAEVELADDERLVSVGVTSEGTGFEFASGLLAVVAFGGAAAAVALSGGAAAPALAAGALASSAAAGITKSGIVEGLTDTEKKLDKPPAMPRFEDLGIAPAYKSAHPFEAEVLRQYRWGLMTLLATHSKLSGSVVGADVHDNWPMIRDVGRSIDNVRTQAARVEDHYEIWKKSKVTSTTRHHSFDIDIRHLPDTQTLKRELAEGARTQDEAKEPWWAPIKDLGIVVTCDWRGAPPADRANGTPPEESLSISYRRPRAARLTTWSVKRRPDAAGRFQATPIKFDHVLVAGGGTEARLTLDPNAFKDSEMTVELSGVGGLKKFGAKRTPASSKAAGHLASLPGVVSGGLKSGAEVAALLAADARKTAWMKGRIDYLETRKKLSGLMTPTPVDEELAELTKQLTQSELEARLAISNWLAAHPDRVHIDAAWTASSGDA